MNEAIRISERDNVAVALKNLSDGETVRVGSDICSLQEPILRGHKFALVNIRAGEDIMKYGSPIGCAAANIAAGGWVHIHNVRTKLSGIEGYGYHPRQGTDRVTGKTTRSFQGYVREDGRCGIRNEIWIIPTVGCINSVAEALAKKMAAYRSGEIDGIFVFPHPYGCSQMGGDQENTRKVLAGLTAHPNAGGVLVIGLGCENCGIETLKPYLNRESGYCENSGRIRLLSCQEAEDEIETGARLLKELIDRAAAYSRKTVDASNLIVGLKCGGSDGLSGITANPLLGCFTDMLIKGGGTAILTEVPEMFGAETILMDRCKNEEVFSKTVELINGFKQYYASHNQVIYENPSPGNKEGGITTLEDKSLGCIQKGGICPVNGVLDYAEPALEKGLNLLCAPGNDLVASTALAVSGAQIVLFTTGRGTPFGAPAPTIKVSSNTELFERKKNWIDYNAGVLAEGADMNVCAEDFFSYVLEVASGRQTQNENNGYRTMAIWKQGVTL